MKLVKQVGRHIDSNAPLLLSVLGTGGFVSSVIMAVRATPAANDAVYLKGPEQTRAEKIRTMVPYYAPTIGMMLISGGCIMASTHISNYRYAALTSVFVSGQEAMSRLQKAMVETVGQKKADAIQQAADNPREGSPTVFISDGEVLCWDSYSSRPFKVDRVEQIQAAVNEVNRIIFLDGFASVNEFYGELFIENIEYGNDIGWSMEDGGCQIRIGSMLTKDQRPCVTIAFETTPKHFLRKYG